MAAGDTVRIFDPGCSFYFHHQLKVGPHSRALKTSDFDYDLPPEYVAQTPIEPRDTARLLVLHRDRGAVEHASFRDLGRYLKAGDVLVVNETRVIRARLFAHKYPGGGRVELLLLHPLDELTWEALVGGKGLDPGRKLLLEGNLQAEIVARLDGPRRLARFSQPIEPHLERIGNVPLPPYIHTDLEDAERYQTVYSRWPGSAAAPTAGLHFTPRLISSLKEQGVRFASVTLHVGLDTFAPVAEADPRRHPIHSEWCLVTREAAVQINQARDSGGRVIAVGTTSVRTLETAARVTSGSEQELGSPGSHSGKRGVSAYEGPTDLYILPGFTFLAVGALITNFHLPRSTLIMLVSAFAGREKILAAYETAKQEGYRFYSFGDAMLIL